MKKLVLFVLAIGLFATSCKKDEDDKVTPDGGSFAVAGKSYTSDYAYWTQSEGLILTNTPVAPAYIQNFVQIYVDSLTFNTKYEYLVRANTNYDKKKNFFSAVVRYNPTNVEGESNEITGVTAGTLNVAKTGDSYTISYNITVNGSALTGTYKGAVAAGPRE